MATIEGVIEQIVNVWYIWVILGLGVGFIYFFLKDFKKSTYYVNFKKVFKESRMKDETLNKSPYKWIIRGDKKIGRIKNYSEFAVDMPNHSLIKFGTAVFYADNIFGFWYNKCLMRFVKTEAKKEGEKGYPEIDLKKKAIIFDFNQTFTEKNGFYVPLSKDGESFENAINTITEDIQRWDKDRTLDINASSMQKLASLPPEWAHEEKLREMDMEIAEKFRKGIGWKAG